MRYAAAVLGLALGASSCVANETVPPGWRLDAGSGEITHLASSLRLPTAFEDLTRGELTAYDSLGANVSVMYARPEPYFVLTLYFYPWDKDISQMMSETLAAIAQLHGGAITEPVAERKILLGSDTLSTLSVLMRYQVEDNEVGSWLAVFSDAKCACKVRASFQPADAKDASWTLVARFLASLKRGA